MSEIIDPRGESRSKAIAETTSIILNVIPSELRDGPRRSQFEAQATALAAALVDADRELARTGSYRDDDLQRVNDAADRLHALDEGFSLSDIDRTWRSRTAAHHFNTHSLFARLHGTADHEATWNGIHWSNWNRVVQCRPRLHVAPTVNPKDIGTPREFEPIQRVVREAECVRVVAGGHAFNESASTGGRDSAPFGTLVSLDRFQSWHRLRHDDAVREHGLESDSRNTLVRAHAGIRLRDLNSHLWAEGLAFPVCGSTDTQSLGGLIASDLHGSGHRHGFLAEQIRELRLVRADGRIVTWSRVPSGWRTDESTPREFSRLPVAGALGMLGVVVDAVLELEPAYYLEKRTRFVDRSEFENDLPGLMARHDHVNVFYPAGGSAVRTVQLNTMDRTSKRPRWTSFVARLAGELGEHALASYAPSMLFDMALRDPENDLVLKAANAAPSNVLPAPAAFTRRLYYLHDEVEYAFPLGMARDALNAALDLLEREELHSIVELRFTPDSAQSLIGPGNCARGQGGAAWLGLATAIGEHSRNRILQAFEKFDRLMRPFGGRPHLGKQTSMDGDDMFGLFGDDWEAFMRLRAEWDPNGKFLPAANPFLMKIFG